jgi:hypothetical protein
VRDGDYLIVIVGVGVGLTAVPDHPVYVGVAGLGAGILLRQAIRWEARPENRRRAERRYALFSSVFCAAIICAGAIGAVGAPSWPVALGLLITDAVFGIVVFPSLRAALGRALRRTGDSVL